MKPAYFAICLISAPALAAGPTTAWEDLAALDGRVAAFIAGDGVAVPLDMRLRLPHCPVSAEITRGGPATVAIRCPALGWRVGVPVQPLTDAPSKAATIIVRRGDIVEIVADGNGFSATGSGSALDQGALGDNIRVKTAPGAAPATAMITAAGLVRVTP